MSVIHGQKQTVNVYVRRLIPRDLPDVLDIEKESFENGWTEKDFRYYMQKKHYGCFGDVDDYFSNIAERNGKIVGFAICELYKDEIRLLNLAVSRGMRRKGIGSQMVANLIERLSRDNLRRIMLEVRETNVDAQIFFRNCGFKWIKTIYNPYDNTQEAAYLMRYLLE